MNGTSPTWKSMIRFEDGSGEVFFGEPTKAGLEEATVWEGSSIFDLKQTGTIKKVAKLLAPYEPDTILCIGLNYQDHAREAKFPIPPYPILFHKSKNAVNGPYSDIAVPSFCKAMDYENELCFVLAKPTKNVSATDVHTGGYIHSYTIGNDVSARDWQKREISGGQFCYGKSFDGFMPFGPALVRPDALSEANDAGDLKIVTKVNGEVCQDSTTKNMIFDVPYLVEFLSRGTTLPQGTLVMTGTPHGVAAFKKSPPEFLKIGDVVECEIQGLGCLKNKLVAGK